MSDNEKAIGSAFAPGPLWAWMEERHAIYIRKSIREGIDPGTLYVPEEADLEEADPDHFALHPKGTSFTRDAVLAEGRFCNVFRELDTVTIWVRENIREPFADHPNLWIMLAIARYINWPPTLEMLINTPGAWPLASDWDPADMGDALDTYQAKGVKVYTGAYMIRAESNRKAEWYNWTKNQYIAQIVIGRLWKERGHFGELFACKELKLKEVWESLAKEKDFIGWGPFMAYEVVTDLRHTRYLEEAPDIYQWGNAGPGALRGLNRLRDLHHNTALNQSTASALMRELLDLARERGHEGKWASWFPWGDLEIRDIEHSLCEVDKWLRMKRGEGKMRAKYIEGRGY